MTSYYTVYKVTNNINGKIYVGTHKTKDLHDSYMGSGKYLKNSIAKHGVENFSKEILWVCDTPELMYELEAWLVNEDFLAEQNTYNLKCGGAGGWDYVNFNGLNGTKKAYEVRRKKYVNDEDFKQRMKDSLAEGRKAMYPEGTFKGKRHTEETKRKMSYSAKQRSLDPTKNSQYGTMWITDGVVNKKLNKDDVIPEGWKKGRILTF